MNPAKSLSTTLPGVLGRYWLPKYENESNDSVRLSAGGIFRLAENRVHFHLNPASQVDFSLPGTVQLEWGARPPRLQFGAPSHRTLWRKQVPTGSVSFHAPESATRVRLTAPEAGAIPVSSNRSGLMPIADAATTRRRQTISAFVESFPATIEQ
jgi:hypothetical protein